MYIEDKTLNTFVLADGEKIEKSCKDESDRFVVFTNKRVLSGWWDCGLPRFSSVPYSSVILWDTNVRENGVGIILYLPNEHEKQYFFEATLGGEIDSILALHVSK